MEPLPDPNIHLKIPTMSLTLPNGKVNIVRQGPERLCIYVKNDWDICAGQIILKESGGTLRNIGNFKSPIFNQDNTLQIPGLVGGNLDICKRFYKT